MIDYSKWKENRINVSSLYLDHLNPRITTGDRGDTQNELINRLIKRYKVYDLAKSIANNGYFPEKSLIAHMEKGKYIVIEGNRRLAAVKSLLNPDIVDKDERRKFNDLNRKVDTNYIKQLRVSIAPSREAANPIILREHTLTTSMPWSKIMQAEFYVRHRDSSMSVSDIGEEYNISESKIREFLTLNNMYQIACCLELDKEIKEKVEDKQSFPATTLERAYDNSSMKDFLGISFSDDGGVTGSVSKKEFEGVYKKIVTDIVENKINSRIINRDEDVEKYIDDNLIKHKPQTKGTFTHADFIPKQDKEEPEVQSSTPRTRSIRKTTALIPSGIPFKLEGSTNLQKFYRELRELSAKKYPNSSAVTLRAFLDKSIRIYLKKQGVKDIEVKEEGEYKLKKIDETTLGEIIDFLTARDVKIISDESVKKVVRHWKSSKDDISLSALNSLVHNEEYAINENNIREIWTKLEGLFKIILLEPEME